MKKLVRMMMCVALLVMTLCTSALAATEEISIKLNGEPVTFTDAAPQIVNDRTYLPFRAVFTALGFADEAINFDGDTRTVQAVSEEMTIAMVIGENRISVTKDGQTEVLETDVPAFIDPQLGRTYVPAKFVSEAAGYRVGWDGESRTVIIDDVETLLAANEAEYTLLDKYLDYSRSQNKKNVRMEGSYATEEYVGGEQTAAEGTYYMLLARDGSYDMELDLAMSVMDEQLGFVIPVDLDMEMRGSTATGESYFRSATLTSMMELGEGKFWFRQKGSATDPAAALEMANSNLFGLTQEELEGLDGKAYVEQMVREGLQEDGTISAADYLAQVNAMLADSSFEKDGTQYTSVYQEGNQALQLTFSINGGKVNGYALVATSEKMGTDGVVVAEYLATAVEKDQMVVESMTQSSTGEYQWMYMDGTYITTNQKPIGEPDEDAIIINLEETEQ